MSVAIDVTRNVANGVTTVSLGGDLDYKDMAVVRSALLKCASECPAGVIVEISGLQRAGAAALIVFATASYRSVKDWGVPVVLSGPVEDIGRKLAVFRSFVTCAPASRRR